LNEELVEQAKVSVSNKEPTTKEIIRNDAISTLIKIIEIIYLEKQHESSCKVCVCKTK
jgi:hypothetical protein